MSEHDSGEAAGDGPPEPPLDFDPYRFGAPEHPIAPEFAPPGYRPPAAPSAPAAHLAPPGPPGAPPPYPAPGYPPAGPPGYPPPAPYGSSYPAPRTGNGKAIAALVLGIVSIPLCFLSLFDLIPITLAVIFGVLALSESRRRPNREGRKLAIAAIACAAVGAILAVLVSVWIISTYKECFDQGLGSKGYNTCIQNKR